MRILHVSTDFPFIKDDEIRSYGGLGLCVMQLVKGLKEESIDVAVLTRHGSPRDREIFPMVVRAPYIGLTSSRDWKLTHGITLIPWLVGMMLNRKYDLVHVHNPPAGIMAIPVAKIIGSKTIMTMHGPWAMVRDRFKTVAKLIESLCLYWADAVTFDSYALKDMYQNNRKFTAIQNAVDTDVFVPMDRISCRKELGMDIDRLVFLYSGRAVFGKSLDTIYNAAKACPWADFIITGANDDRSDIDQPNVKYRRTVSNFLMPKLYNACDAVILPTKAEGMSRALLEAMSCGVAVFVSDIAANAETIGSAGKMFKTDDELIGLLKKHSRLELIELGKIGRKHVSGHFNIENRIDMFINVYNKLLMNKNETD